MTAACGAPPVAGEAVDGAALSFITAHALEAKRKGELKAAKRQQQSQGGVVKEVPAGEWRSIVNPHSSLTYFHNQFNQGDFLGAAKWGLLDVFFEEEEEEEEEEKEVVVTEEADDVVMG